MNVRLLLVSAVVLATAGCPGPDVPPAGDVGLMDGGASDAPARDAGRTTCATAADCDDGLFCNGVETCGASDVCAAGTRPCAAVDCDEATDTCDCTEPDMDGDGQDSIACGGLDCDDTDRNRAPGRTEVCDTMMHDEDCNPATFGFSDLDSDGHVSAGCCNDSGTGTPVCGTDCDDMAAGSHPGLPEACDGRDNDCNGTIDEGVLTTYYRDSEPDGYGVAAMTMEACSPPAGYAALAGDCDDAVATTHPGARDECNGANDDCVGGADDDASIPCGCTTGSTGACPQPGVCAGGTRTCVAGTWGPCSITGTSETCNGLDDDCDGSSDEAPAATTCAARPFTLSSCGTSPVGCSYTCVTSYGDCDGNASNGCETDTRSSTMHCRGCGMACTPGAAVTGVACADPTGCVIMSCSAGVRDCNGVFSDGCETSIRTPSSCGACGVACPVRANTTASCPAESCTYACLAGFANCAGDEACETATTSDPMHCGGCAPCTPPANASATCTSGICNFVCDAGYARVGSSCVMISPPRAIGPLADQVVTSRHPWIRWSLGTSSDGAHVEICSDAACGTVVASQDATGTTLNLASALAPGTYYWRAAGRYMGVNGTVYNTPRRFVSYALADTTYATVAQTFLDVDGQGTDVAVGRGSDLYVRLYRSSGSAVDATEDQRLDGRPVATFGYSLAPAGDVNGDGRGDLVVGACAGGPTSCGSPPCAPDASTCSNRAYVFYASATAAGTFDTATRTEITAPVGANGFGYSVAAAGDVNADGYADVVVGSYWTNTAYVYFGSPTGISLVGSASMSNLGGTGVAGGLFGLSVNGAGDFNGDGYGDVVVGQPFAGGPFLYLGPTLAMRHVLDAEWGSTGTNIGISVASAGDFNGDGLPDVIAGGNGTPSSPGVTNGGHAVIFAGTTAAPGTRRRIGWVLGTSVGQGLGVSVAGLGDTNADGLSDVLVGSPGTTSAIVYRGTTGGMSTTVLTPLLTVAGSTGFGRWVGATGDVNRDNRADFIVAAAPNAFVYLAAGGAPHVTLTGVCDAGLPR